METLLLLTCGTNACFHIARLLKEKFEDSFRIIGTDINPGWQVPVFPYLDFFQQCPLSSDGDYYAFILSLCKREKVDYLLPSFDADQQLFYDGNPDLKALGVRSFAISKSIRDIYRSKRTMNSFLQDNHFPTPKIYSLKEIDRDASYFVKPVNGVGSVGAGIVPGRSIDEECAAGNLIEEICHGPEVTLECFFYKGEVYSVARERLASKNGVCTKTRVYHDKDKAEMARRLAGLLPFPYMFNLQFMYNGKGESVITDVNLRSAGGMSMSYTAGWDAVGALAGIMLHLPDREIVGAVRPVSGETYVMRAFSDIITKRVGKKIAFDLDGTLLDSRARHERVMETALSLFETGFETDDLLAFKAEGHNNMEWLAGKGVDQETARMIQNRWISLIETKKFLALDKLYNGVLPYLDKLSKDNELFLITGRNRADNAMEQVRRLGLLGYFKDVKIVKSDANLSSAKATYLRDNGIDEYIGDTESDLKAARLAGCRFFAATNGFRSKAFWKRYDVEYMQEPSDV